jgi:hypothetical protein
MSVKTTADGLVDDMRKQVAEALKATNKAFTEIVVLDETWGANEFTEEFKQKIAKAQRLLIEIKQELGERKYFD